MAADARKLYADTIQHLSASERLKLATMILRDLAGSDSSVDFSDAWSQQDLRELTSFALSHSENPHEKKNKNP